MTFFRFQGGDPLSGKDFSALEARPSRNPRAGGGRRGFLTRSCKRDQKSDGRPGTGKNAKFLLPIKRTASEPADRRECID